MHEKLIPPPVAALLGDLFASDQATRGRPVLHDSELELARAWACEVLADPDKLEGHVARLAELYRGVHGTDNVGFTHCALLEEPLAEAIVARGPAVLAADALAVLLLSPFALHDLAERIREETPEWWEEPLTRAGRDLIERHGLVIELPAEVAHRLEGGKKRPQFTLMGQGRVEQVGDALVIGFTEESREQQRRIAAVLYGDPEKAFTLTLHRRQRTEAGYTVELEVSPAPVKDGLRLPIDINGEQRWFAIEVPLSVKLDPDADPPPRVFARAAEAVAEAAFHLNGEAEWRDDGWLVLRNRRSA